MNVFKHNIDTFISHPILTYHGVPLLIQAVGSALKNKNIDIWDLALNQLKKHAPKEIDPDIKKAFTHLQLSYDYLVSEEAKSCFLLCSLFPEDEDIKLEMLVLYGVGLGKFDDLDSMKDARGRVQNAVNILTSSGLLLNVEDDKECTKMHDVVRDVALLIASEGENKYLVKAGKGLTEWLPLTRDRSLKSMGISFMNSRISKFPDYNIDLPHLEIFIINGNAELQMISDEFIQSMREVKVLDMGSCRNAHLPQSLKLLTKLRMLNLTANECFHEISILGEMKDLEILILNETGIKEIPQEIGQLVNLRRLEVLYCRDMTHVTLGVISKLQRLEELWIDFSQVREGVNDCIVEVIKLRKLTYLDLMVKSFDVIPEGFNSEKLKGFVIQIGGECRQGLSLKNNSNSDCYLHIENLCLVFPLFKRIKKLTEVSRLHITLTEIKNLNNIIPDLYPEGFNKLEHIELSYCSNVSCLVDSTSCDWDEGKTQEKYFMELKHLELWELGNLEVLWKCPEEYIILTNLVTLEIRSCNKLERVFTVSVAQGLVNLKYLHIQSCKGLEEVIWSGKGGETEEIIEQQSSSANNIIVFPSLAKIFLHQLDSLKSFYPRNCTIIYPSLVDVSVMYCFNMKTWGPGIHETPNLKFLNESLPLLDGPCAINDAVKKQWRKNKQNSW